MGPKVRKKSTPRMKSKQPKSRPTQVMEKFSPSMEMGTSRTMPAPRSRSPLATVTWRCAPQTASAPGGA